MRAGCRSVAMTTIKASRCAYAFPLPRKEERLRRRWLTRGGGCPGLPALQLDSGCHRPRSIRKFGSSRLISNATRLFHLEFRFRNITKFVNSLISGPAPVDQFYDSLAFMSGA